ncbi:MAG: zinc-ribbon domain-containing protein [Terriglobales bacterium]
MAFCTGCGTRLDDNTKFCINCGTPAGGAAHSVQAPMPGQAAAGVAPAPVPAMAQPAGAAPKQGSGALKIILIVVGIFVLLGIITVGTIGYGVYRAKKAIVNETGGSTTVTLPGMKISSGEGVSAEKVAADLAVEVYPGAQVRANSAATMNIGGVVVGGAEFETSDPVSSVVEFYRGKYPNSTVESADENSHAIVVSSEKGFVTIEIRQEDGMTRIHLSRMAGTSGQ